MKYADMERIAGAAEAIVSAHKRRATGTPFATLREQDAVDLMRRVLAEVAANPVAAAIGVQR